MTKAKKCLKELEARGFVELEKQRFVTIPDNPKSFYPLHSGFGAWKLTVTMPFEEFPSLIAETFLGDYDFVYTRHDPKIVCLTYLDFPCEEACK